MKVIDNFPMVFFSADPTPNSENITTTCPRVFNRVEGRYIYNFTWKVDFSEAVLSGVNNFVVSISDIDPRGKPLRERTFILDRVNPGNVSNYV